MLVGIYDWQAGCLGINVLAQSISNLHCTVPQTNTHGFVIKSLWIINLISTAYLKTGFSFSI